MAHCPPELLAGLVAVVAEVRHALRRQYRHASDA
jgi:hypothetical protein